MDEEWDPRAPATSEETRNEVKGAQKLANLYWLSNLFISSYVGDILWHKSGNLIENIKLNKSVLIF